MNLFSRDRQYIDMLAGSPVRLIARFSLPLIVGNLLQQLYTFVDAAVIGRYVGVNAFAAIGCTGWIVWWINSAARDCSNAICIAASIRIGNHNYDEFRRILANGVMMAAALTALAMLVLLGGLDLSLRLLNVQMEIYDDARAYLMVLVLAIPATMTFHVAGALLRAAGNSSVTSAAMTAATVMNIALDLVFVLAFHWDVIGVAVATLLAQAAAMTVALLAARKNPLFHTQRAHWRLDGRLMGEMLRLLAPMMLNSLVITFGGLYVQQAVNAIGTHFTAGVEVGGKIFSLLEAVIMAVQTGASVFVGQNLGASQPHRIRSGLRRIVLFSLLLTLGMIALVWLFGGSLIRFFLSSRDPALFEAAYAVALRNALFLVTGMVIMTPMYLYRASLQTIGHPNYAMIAGVLQVFARMGTVELLVRFFGNDAIFFADVLAWTVSLPVVAIPFGVYMRRLCRQKERETALQAQADGV